jgi:hypothetical protein
MPRFIAEFRKRVLSDSGHEFVAVQRRFDVDAPNGNEARKLAEQRFCTLENVSTWKSHADELNIVEADLHERCRRRRGRKLVA